MNLEILKRSQLKRNIIIGVVAVLIISAIILNFTRAKYRTTQSIPLVNGTINYSASDLNIVAITVDGESYDTIPEGNYELTEESYCTINGEKAEITFSWNSATKNLTISPFTAKGTKCYLDFKKSNSLFDVLLNDNPTRLTRNDFSNPFETENTGTLYTVGAPWIEEFDNSLDTVYYFAGNALKNWVKFGKDSNNNDLYWRIIRTNEDGSIKMLYSGIDPNTTSGYINPSSSFNPSRSNPMYAGYMYGPSGSLTDNRTNTTNSIIKGEIDNWYSNGLNIKTDSNGNKYDDYISKTATYCNDRAYDGTYATNREFIFPGYNRLIDNNQPSFKCGNQASGIPFNTADIADKFSVSTTNNGNGNLTYPIALMTADEIVFAGGVFNQNSKAWYYYNASGESITGTNWWWTMTPEWYMASYTAFIIAYMFSVQGTNNPGQLDDNYVNLDYDELINNANVSIRPAISLKSCVEWTAGNGSSSNPYEVNINSTCANAEN